MMLIDTKYKTFIYINYNYKIVVSVDIAQKCTLEVSKYHKVLCVFTMYDKANQTQRNVGTFCVFIDDD